MFSVRLALRYHKDYIQTDQGFMRVLFVEEFASRLSDELIHDLMGLPRQMMLSMDIEPINTQEAHKLLNGLALRVESDIGRWQQRQNNNNNFAAEIPYEFQQMRKVVADYMDDITEHDQRLMLTTITIVHSAKTLEQLERRYRELAGNCKRFRLQSDEISLSAGHWFGHRTPVWFAQRTAAAHAYY